MRRSLHLWRENEFDAFALKPAHEVEIVFASHSDLHVGTQTDNSGRSVHWGNRPVTKFLICSHKMQEKSMAFCAPSTINFVAATCERGRAACRFSSHPPWRGRAGESAACRRCLRDRRGLDRALP